MITILFLSANPAQTDKLNLSKEVNEIDKEIRFAAGKEIFKIEQYHDISISEIRKQLLNYSPQVVHFSGHGSPRSELVFSNENGDIEVVPSSALSGLFEILSKDISLVFLNACYSQEQAEAIAKHVNCVIGMSRAISDEAAIKFAVSFYSSLGFGRSVKDAFALSLIDLKFFKIPEESTPQMCLKEGIDPSKIFIPKINGNGGNGDSDICNLLKDLKQYRQKVIGGEVTIEKFYESIGAPIFDFLSIPNNKKKIGEVNSDTLNRLLISLAGKLQEYNKLIGLDNESLAAIKVSEFLVILNRMEEKLDKICNK
jgi:hypothetical protein